jgi:hypothetical protein
MAMATMPVTAYSMRLVLQIQISIYDKSPNTLSMLKPAQGYKCR